MALELAIRLWVFVALAVACAKGLNAIGYFGDE